jgi:hypothetical protein
VPEVLNAARALAPIKPVAPASRPKPHPVGLVQALIAAWVPLSVAGLLPIAQALLLLRLCLHRPSRLGGLRLVLVAWLGVSVNAGLAAWHHCATVTVAMWQVLAAAAGGIFVAMAVSAGAAADMRGPRFVRAVMWLGAMLLVVACARRAALALHASALTASGLNPRLFFPNSDAAHIAGLGIAFIGTRERALRWRAAGMAGGIAAWLSGADAATVAAGAGGAAMLLLARARPAARVVLIAFGAAAVAAWYSAAAKPGTYWPPGLNVEQKAAILAGAVTCAVIAARLMQTLARPHFEDAAAALGLAVCVTAMAAKVPVSAFALPCLFGFLWIGACAAPVTSALPSTKDNAGGQNPEAFQVAMARSLRAPANALAPGAAQPIVRASSFQARAGRRN